MPEIVDHDPILALASPELLLDPYPAYGNLRRERPAFFYDRLNSWIFSQYDDCVAVLKDSANFAADWRRVGETMPPRAINMLTLDPPEHTVVRRLFMEALRAQDHMAVEQMIAQHTADLLAALARRPSFELLTEFAEPLALSTTSAYLGVPMPDPVWASQAARAIVAGMDAGLWPERAQPVLAAQEELAVLVEDWLAHPPPSGVVGIIVKRAAGSGVDPAIIANTVRGLLFSGYSSGSKLLGLVAVALLHERVAELERFREADTARAVDEMVRYASPIQVVARACVHDTGVGGVTVRAGQAVTLLLGAANRDPARFPDPDVVRLDRHPNPHLGFGRGPKSCLGSPFTAIFTRVVLRVLAELYPGIRALGAPTYFPNLTARSIERFEVTLR
ncbi:cytochrome P450 [Nonomuraea sp. H19]|uniref:cytochrome P450 n=1 Tax=Nonomuraea sp. H19 TaxID=3452206 RepID=UPI003F88D11E